MHRHGPRRPERIRPMTETALKRYMVPSGYGVEENPNGLLYKKECVDPILQELTARAEKAEAECDHALARLGVALTGARDRYAQAMLDYDYDESGPALAGLIRDLPLDPDAEAALQRALDAEW